MANNWRNPVGVLGHIGAPSATAATGKTGFALDAAYAYGSAGDVLGVRFIAPVTAHLSDVYFYVTATAGTPGDLTVELRNFGAVAKPGTLVGSATISPGTTADKWIHLTGQTWDVTQGITYWVCIGDAGWTTGNTATVCSKGSLGFPGANYQRFASYTSTDGFTTAGTNAYAEPAMVLKFDDAGTTIIGQPFTTGANDAYNARERGIKIAGLTEQLTVNAVWIGSGGSVTGMKIYSGTTIPGGTADATYTWNSSANALNVGGYGVFPGFTFAKNTVYRCVLTLSGSDTSPTYMTIEDAAGGGADVLAASMWGGNIYHTVSDGGTPAAWVDSTDKMPLMALFIQDQVAIAAGGGMLKAEKRGGKQ